MIAASITRGKSAAEMSQTLRASISPGARWAITATTAARPPTATIPHPDTAVKEPAASIGLRINARLSIARAWRAGGSFGGGGLSGRTDVMRIVYPAAARVVKYFAS